jgi:preprotein translocase subunit SecE
MYSPTHVAGKEASVRAEPTTEKAAVRPSPFTAITDYVKDVRVEMSKVTWPTRRELQESTLVVIVMVFVISIFIGIVDRALSYAFEALIRMLG